MNKVIPMKVIPMKDISGSTGRILFSGSSELLCGVCIGGRYDAASHGDGQQKAIAGHIMFADAGQCQLCGTLRTRLPRVTNMEAI